MPPERISFAGPGKTAAELARARADPAGRRVHHDALAEGLRKTGGRVRAFKKIRKRRKRVRAANRSRKGDLVVVDGMAHAGVDPLGDGAAEPAQVGRRGRTVHLAVDQRGYRPEPGQREEREHDLRGVAGIDGDPVVRPDATRVQPCGPGLDAAVQGAEGERLPRRVAVDVGVEGQGRRVQRRAVRNQCAEYVAGADLWVGRETCADAARRHDRPPDRS